MKSLGEIQVMNKPSLRTIKSPRLKKAVFTEDMLFTEGQNFSRPESNVKDAVLLIATSNNLTPYADILLKKLKNIGTKRKGTMLTTGILRDPKNPDIFHLWLTPEAAAKLHEGLTEMLREPLRKMLPFVVDVND